MSDLDVRFTAHLRASRWLDDAPGVVIGVSGGLDSMVLLHLMRFGEPVPPVPVHAAHVDHRMREGSAEDAAWVVGICAEWGVPCHLHRAVEPVTSEEAGRELRYGFFGEVLQSQGDGTLTMTAHTADDQAETVLFRAARGSGVRGLAGIRPVRSPSLVRPLLPFWRRELEEYAAAHGIPFREDPTNRDRRWTRNRLRHEILPALEEAVPGAARALAALAETTHLHAVALDELLDARIDALAAGTGDETSDELLLDRNALCALSDPVLALTMRRAAARLGGDAGRAATVAMVRFVRESPSGRGVDVGGGVVVERQLSAVRIRRRGRESRPVPPPVAVRIDGRESGEGIIPRGDGRGGPARVAWGPSPRPGFPHVAHIACDSIRFPLVLRAWKPGDRVQMPYGHKKVKKLLLEARVPADRREHLAVLADATGTILWIPGVTDPVSEAEAPRGSRVCCVSVSFDDEP